MTPRAEPSPDAFPRGPLMAVGALVLATLAAVSVVRLSGMSIHAPDAPAQATLALRFEDRPDGSIAVISAQDNRQIDSVVGQAGFVRGTLRGLARERRREGIGEAPPFELVAHTDGRLTLLDPSTGRRVDLESFGPTNAANFARFLELAHAQAKGEAKMQMQAGIR